MNAFANPEVERTLLVSALEYAEAYHQAVAMGLGPDDFVDEAGREIFRIMSSLGESGAPVSSEAVISELLKANDHDRLIATFSDLQDAGNVPRQNVEWHVRELQDRTRRRRLKVACEQGIAAVEDPTETTSNCFEYLTDSLLRIETETSRDALRAGQFLPQVLKDLETRGRQEGLIGLSTGIPDLDEMTTGIRPGELWVIGALPGRGKTALGAQIAVTSARRGTGSAIFSLEMSRDELGARVLANESRVSASRIRNPRWLRKEDWGALINLVSNLEECPFFVDDAPSLTIQALTARARLYIRRHQVKLIVVDYLRLVQAPGKDLRERLGNATDALRQLAKSEKVAVIALSQLRRPESINARPNMLDLKESGDIEAHAHVVLLIYTPVESDSPTGLDEIIIGKNRHGPIGAIEVAFSRERLKFLPRETKREERAQ